MESLQNSANDKQSSESLNQRTNNSNYKSAINLVIETAYPPIQIVEKSPKRVEK